MKEKVREKLEHMRRAELGDILRVQSAAMKAVHDHMWKNGIAQLTPVMLSTVTDPLCHSVEDASLTYGEQKLQLTKSMILHKQLAVGREDVKGIYIVSPNVRLEKPSCASSGRHLLEFSQVDIELRGATAADFMLFMESLYVDVLTFVKRECGEELGRLGRELKVPGAFPVYESSELLGKYGGEFERVASLKEETPFWIMGHLREFYDRQDPLSGKHINYDLVYPEGFGEALSGGEREYEYARIVEKMKERKTDTSSFEPYLEAARSGALVPSAGGGFGVERLVRYLTGREHVKDVVLFPRVPGEGIVF